MARTPSKMIPLNTTAPDFQLLNVVSGNTVGLQELRGEKATLVMFICNHCPFVIHIQDELLRLANDYLPKGVAVIAISSNDVENYPQDSPEKMRELALSLPMPFPYLYDETQQVAKQYDAACTPDFYLFNAELKLAYRGQLDGARPGNNEPVNGADLRAAIDGVLQGKEPLAEQLPSLGCNIKWKDSSGQ